MKRLAGLAFLALVLVPCLAAADEPYRLAPFKDELFAYPKILDTALDGAYREVEYDRPRDLYARDTEPGLKVDPKYVSLDTEVVEADLTLEVGGITVDYLAAGKLAGDAKSIVVFVHGRGTGRATGFDDWIHGGNFNRIKNLMMRNDGVYLSPSFANFGDRGAEQVATLVLHYAALSPAARVFLACGSAGAQICWRLIADAGVRPLISGLILFDPMMTKDDLDGLARLPPAERVPVHISGSREDTVVGWRSQRDRFAAMKVAVPDYPIRYVLFSAGTHGLSLRMTDWRETINWMLEAREAGEGGMADSE